MSLISANAQNPVVPILEMKVGGLIGGVQNGSFINPVNAFAQLKGKGKYTIYGAKGRVGEMTAEIESPEVPCEQFYSVKSEMRRTGGVAIGANPGWRLTPRTAKSLDLKNTVYMKAASDVLKTKSITARTVKLTQAFIIDLEGDGQTEVVLAATSYAGDITPKARKNDYSFVMLRKIVGGKAQNILINGEFVTKNIEFGAPHKFEISSIADLNGDGKMEIVVFGQYYEGAFAEVYEINGNKPTKVLETGCGV
jgi:uncharacterized protein (DUF2141 family)